MEVHAEGRLRAIEDRAWLRDHVTALAAVHEAGQATPWAVGDAPAAFIDKQLGGIVGLTLTVERLEGVWKMNQHHPEGNRTGVIDGLSASPRDGDQRVAAIMRDLEDERSRT